MLTVPTRLCGRHWRIYEFWARLLNGQRTEAAGRGGSFRARASAAKAYFFMVLRRRHVAASAERSPARVGRLRRAARKLPHVAPGRRGSPVLWAAAANPQPAYLPRRQWRRRSDPIPTSAGYRPLERATADGSDRSGLGIWVTDVDKQLAGRLVPRASGGSGSGLDWFRIAENPCSAIRDELDVIFPFHK
jgi:hypothetical protein